MQEITLLILSEIHSQTHLTFFINRTVHSFHYRLSQRSKHFLFENERNKILRDFYIHKKRDTKSGSLKGV
jgi:hypothetical protein